MNLHILCKSIETRVAKELALARSQEEKTLILTSALYEYGHSVLKALDSISPTTSGPAGHRQTQAAASELLTFLVLPYLSSCSSYKQGITVLEDLGELCQDEALRRRVVIYTNQLKRRWHQADPSALPINPRAARVRLKKRESQLIEYGALILLLLAVGFYFMTHLNLASLVFPGGNATPQLRGEVARTENEVAAPPPSRGAEPQASTSGGEYFSYTDSKGVVHLGNNPTHLSPQLPPGRATVPPGSPDNTTPVVIKGNQVLVPVTLSYRGRSVRTTLLLDTGATVTTITGHIAAQLGVDQQDTSLGTSTVADGRRIETRFFTADSVAVGPRSLPQLRTSILPGSGSPEHEGLLGMDFLKNLRYHVDFNRSVIEWNVQ